MLTINNLSFISVIIIFLSILTNLSSSICPSSEAIVPCTCDDEGLRCASVSNLSLTSVFSASSPRPAIRKVWIIKTDIESLGKSSFGDYIIRDLFLEYNNISSIHNEAFGNALETMQTLSLSHNKLLSFPFHILTKSVKLTKLGLSYNYIEYISAQTIPYELSLETLDLANNKIKTIEPYSFQKLPNLSVLDLSKNKLIELKRNSLAFSQKSHENVTVSINYLSSRASKVVIINGRYIFCLLFANCK